MPTLTVNDVEVTVPTGSTVLQACEAAGFEIPIFCYHPRLNIAGNCRMCLVEMERSAKPIASCAMPAGDGMVIRTNTAAVEKARKGVLEMLLINHPLDCPICDQGGECDLQDITMFYGPSTSRFTENKRPVSDKYLGPLISTHMTRCIHCTRCIRFANEIAGVEELGAVGRGEHMEITSYLEHAVTSELSGNVIDLCPVGALNNKPYEYSARTWELKKTESVDVLDAVGSNIRVDAKVPEVKRILPRLNEDVNEEWISDKTRFSYDGLRKRRLDRVYVKQHGKLGAADWPTAFASIRDRLAGLDPNKVAVIAGNLADCESMMVAKDFAERLGTPHVDCRLDGAALDAHTRSGYLFNTTIAGIESADVALLIGSNPRFEAPLINARLRKRYRMGGFALGRVGAPFDLTYPVADLGAGGRSLQELQDGSHEFNEVLNGAANPMLILGQGALMRPDGAAVLAAARAIAERHNMVREDWNGFNVLHTAAARVGGLDLGLVPGAGGKSVPAMLDAAQSGEIEVVFLLNADELDTSKLTDAFVVYLGHHGDAGAKVADVILPAAAYTEKHGLYVNTEGRPQQGKLAVFPPGEAKEDWKILRALSEACGHTVPVNTIGQVRQRIGEVAPHLLDFDVVTPAPWGEFGRAGALLDQPFASPISNFYATNVISRASTVMRQCEDELAPRRGADTLQRTGTHG